MSECPNVLWLEVNGDHDADYSTCKVLCMADVPKRLVLQGKEYNLVQVVLYGKHHYIGVTIVKGKFLLYDGMAQFGIGKNKIKNLGDKAKFPKGFNVNSLWYKSKSPLPQPLKKPKTAEEIETTLGAKAVIWYRKAKDHYKDHPMFKNLSDKYGQMPGGLYGQVIWKGFKPLKELYSQSVDNEEEFHLVEDKMTDDDSDTDKESDQDDEDLKDPMYSESEMVLDSMDNATSSIPICKNEETSDDEGENGEGRGLRNKRKTPKWEEYSSNTGTSTTKKSAKSKQLALPLGVHLSQVSTKGKIPTCRHCRRVIEGRGTWHAIQVLPNSTFGLPAAARNEYHYHCKCVMKVFQYNDIEQLIDIVNSKTEINGVDKNRIIDSINSGQD